MQTCAQSDKKPEASKMSETNNTLPDTDLQAQLQTLRQQVILLSQDKKIFLDNMSHELRTPINSILLLANLLEKNPDGNLTPKQVEYASVIQGSANDLLLLINELLAISTAALPSTDSQP